MQIFPGNQPRWMKLRPHYYAVLAPVLQGTLVPHRAGTVPERTLTDTTTKIKHFD
ncbi:hypothetical protein B9Z19DRAFT_1070245 [Tuber borchii]|uniref:Uncharacterized protein n=1 Tax=Tuber borchii TaxID=42251 RepID=A0A2T7A9I6_TUBBO|nr:hypothetical protein B9Z19DRAFT_1070245 [Tuber borchii]